MKAWQKIGSKKIAFIFFFDLSLSLSPYIYKDCKLEEFYRCVIIKVDEALLVGAIDAKDRACS